MGDGTTIEWTDGTFNPWWGCTNISPGCDRCYAEAIAARFAPGMWGAGAPRREFGDAHWKKPVEWNARAMKAGKRMRVFCASMADVFDKDAPDGARERLWALIEATPMLDWQLLTKRVGNVRGMVPERWIAEGFPPHVWLGITVVNQEEADRDILKLLALPARVRWLSCEPLLGPIHVGMYLSRTNMPGLRLMSGFPDPLPGIDWVVAGGESGRDARPMHPDWARQLRDLCAIVGVPFLFKQWGEYEPVYDREREDPDWRRCKAVEESMPGGRWLNLAGGHGFHGERLQYVDRVGKKRAGRTLDGRTWDEYPA